MLINLLKFNLRMYLKSNKFIVPIIAFFSYLAMAYSIAPVSVLPSYILSSMVVFLIMVWISFSYNDVEAMIIEQVIYLKVKNKYEIWVSKILLMFLFGLIFSFVATIYPLVINAISNYALFDRAIQIRDVIVALIVHFVYACVGSMIGLIFNVHIFKNRKQAVTFIILIALVTLLKGLLEHDLPLTRIITWILPPLFNLSQKFTGMEFVNFNSIIYPLCATIIYIMIEIAFYIKLMKYKLF